MIEKHAFLVMAHNDFELLKTQIKLLDDKRNDLYIHIDSKSDFENFEELKTVAKKSKIEICKQINVKWGDTSIVDCVMLLLKKATQNEKYEYYHIISGVDLPIKTQDEFHDFFQRNRGKEFVHFDAKEINQINIDRVKYRHFLNGCYKISKYKVINKMVFILDDLLVNIQKIFKIEKKNPFDKIQKGCNWCSITDEFARYIISEEQSIQKLIKYSKIPDEIFIQTLLENSKYKENLYKNDYNNDYDSCARLIIWDEKNYKSPHTFTIEDWELIKNSNAMFARKFSTNKDIEIIEKIYNFIKNGEEEK